MTAIPLKPVLMSGAVLIVLGLASIPRLEAQSAEDLRMTVGKSVVIDYPTEIRQISTSNPDIIDASPVTTKEILMHGKGLGSATMVVWSKTGERMFYNVNVELNLDPLKRLLKESFPEEQIVANSSRDSISLNGVVSNKDVGDRAVALAANFGKTVVNNLSLAPSGVEKQILLRVRFADLDRSKELQYGVNLLGQLGQTTLGGNTGQFSPPAVNGSLQNQSSIGGSAASGATSTVTTSISQALNIFALNPKLNLGAFIKALQDQNVLQVLAEPNLVTSNGREANFLVGGEFPIPVLQGGANSGAVTIQYREFGIRLMFTPVITPNNTIKLYLKQEVSTLDYAHGVTLNGFSIPGLSTRRAETNVELSEGQSFVVAGLVDNEEREAFSKVPVIGSIPILGELFRTRDEIRSRTDLVMLVTPEITMPLNASDPQPQPYFPKDFLVRLDPKDVPKETPANSPKGSKKK